MKRIGLYGVLYSIILLSMGFVFNACVDEKEEALGSIYGVVTKEGTIEVMPAIGIELYRDGSLLLKTVTFDDGHFEFTDLKAGNYRLKIVADGWEETEYSVIVEGGRQARQDMQVKKVNTHMSVRTMNATDQKGNTVTLNGYVSYDGSFRPVEAGFYYSASSDPLSGTKVIGGLDSTFNSFSATINGLSFGNYYVMAYGKNSVGVTYGDVRTFTMTNFPVVETKEPTNVLANTATLNGLIVSEGDPAYTERGFVYSKSYSTPTVDDPENATNKVVVSGTNKEFSVNVSSLIENSTYYVRAYAKHEKGTVYGAILTFVPQAILPQVTTLDVTNVMAESATLNGRIDASGEPPYIERGFIYSISYKNPTLNDPASATFKKIVPGMDKEFSANMDSLITGTTYYVRAYALSSKGVAYGDAVSFTPTAVMPVIRTLAVTNLLAESVSLNGQIDAVGEPPYTERGFIYTTSNVNPTINDPSSVTQKIIVPGTDKKYSANISGLSTGTTYRVRAYAVTAKGVAYGDSVSFIPKAVMPVVATLAVSNILAESATLNGRIDNVGEPAYTECGFVYSKSYENPTINDPESATMKVVVSGSEKEFSANINALTTGKLYYVRAYAVSSKGVSYGTVVTFKPQSAQYVILEDFHLMVMTEDLAKSATWSQAKDLCKNSYVGGYKDWRLPTRTEANVIATYIDEIGGFDIGTYYYYWTSDADYGYPYYYYFNNSKQKSEGRISSDSTNRVRAVRTIP